MILNIITTPTNGVCFYGDSLISSYNVENNPHLTTWTMRLVYDPSYAYPGDIVSESYAGKILSTDLQTDEEIQAVAAKLASFPVQKYWFEGGFNDYAFSNFEDRPDLTLIGFTDKYQKLVDYLHALKPSAKIFIQTIGETFYTLQNAETVEDPLASPLIYTGPTAEDYRMVQRIIAGRRSSYCEFVDFTTADSTFKGVYGETAFPIQEDNDNGTTLRAQLFYQLVPDGAHPNIEGSKKWAEAVKKRSSLFGAMTNPLPISILTEELPTALNPQAHKQTSLKTVTAEEVYSQYFTASNGFGPITFSVSAGTLPAGLTLNTSTGHLSGTVTATGGSSFSFTITGSDTSGRSGSRSFSGVVGGAGGGSTPGSATISYASVVSSDVYDREWTEEAITGYSLVTRSGNILNPTSNPSGAKAGLFCYFGSGSGASTGNITFTARGSGIMQVVVFTQSLTKAAQQTFTLAPTNTVFSMPITLVSNTEYRLGIFFTGDGSDILANNAQDVVIENDFAVNFTGSNFYNLSGNYIRLRWDETSILGNGYTNWSGRRSWSQQTVPAKKFFKHSSWSFMRLQNCNASKIVIEYVNAIDQSVPVTVFENAAMTSFITYEPDGVKETSYFTVKRKEITLVNPGVNRTIEIVSSGQGLLLVGGVYYDHTEFAAGCYVRAVYINEGATYTLDTTPHPESISFIGDSIINTMDPVTFINNPSAKLNWIHDIHRNGSATYNYPGDIFTDSSSSRSLGQDLQDPVRRENLVQRLITMGAKKIYIEGSTNDFWTSEPGRTYVQSSVFKANYKAFVDRLLAVIPGCKIFIHVQYRFTSFWESGINGETPTGLTWTQWRQKVREVYTENYTGNAQVELVDFEPIWATPIPPSGTAYSIDGLHPNYTAGQAKLAAELIARSNIEVPLALSFSPGTLSNVTVNNPFSQTFTATNGTGPYIFSVAPGSTLPGWLTLTGAVLSGTAPGTTSSSSFSIRVTDSLGATFTKALTLSVGASNMVLTPSSLTPAVRNVAYSQAISVTGAGGTLAYSATGLPTGLTINSSTGLISGTPAIGNSTGTYTVVITANDGYNSQNFSRSLVLNGAALTVNPSSVTNPQVSIFFTQTFTTTGGTAPYTYSVSGQPTGLTMSSGGVLSGTPSATGAFTFTVTSTDSVGNVGTRTISTTVQAAPKVVNYEVYNSGGFIAIRATLTKPGGGGFTALFRTIVNITGPSGYIDAGYVNFAPGNTSSTTNFVTGAAYAPGSYSVTVTTDETYQTPGTGSFEGVLVTYDIPDITILA